MKNDCAKRTNTSKVPVEVSDSLQNLSKVVDNVRQSIGNIPVLPSTSGKSEQNELPPPVAVSVETEEDIEKKERETLMGFISECVTRQEEKKKLRQNNQECVFPDESEISKRDSSLKKNTAFIRKLKNFPPPQLDQLLKDMNSLNLTKYLSEVVSALTEIKLKMTEIDAMILLCTQLNITYSDFSKIFFEQWQKILNIKKDDKIANMSKFRVDLRLFAELTSAGIVPQKEGLILLGNILTILINSDLQEHNNLNIILSFCKYCGDDYAGLVPKEMQKLAEKYDVEIPKSDMLSSDKQKNVRVLLKEYYVSLCNHVKRMHHDIEYAEKQNEKILQTKGELRPERKAKNEQMNVTYQKLYSSTLTFADILNEPFIMLKEEKKNSSTEDLTDSELDIIGTATPSELTSLWEDEETQKFYEEFPNLSNYIPDKNKKLDEPEEIDIESNAKKSISDIKDAAEIEVSNIGTKVVFETFIEQLPKCVNREMIDNLAIEFLINLNTKNNRKKLVKVLFSVPRTRVDLLPFYTRLVAILNPLMPEVGLELCSLLKSDFRYNVKKKDQINIETKLKVVRYIGEMVKFNLMAKSEALHCFKMLLNDFTHHHIEMGCALLETAGRFLYRSPESHHRTKIYLEQMMRVKSISALRPVYVTMIENAYYFVNPTDSPAIMKKQRPILHEFIRHLLYNELKDAPEKENMILSLLKQMDWENLAEKTYLIKCLTEAWNVTYPMISDLACLVAAFVDYDDSIGTRVVDGVMEDIRVGLETNLVKFNQRRIAMIKYFGELYNYRLIESNDVFKVLYSFVSFGVVYDPDFYSTFDPPQNLFRLKLICVLLDTCGEFFNRGPGKLKLDCFILYFQYYFWLKKSSTTWDTQNPFPVTVDYMVTDVLKKLRPNLKMKNCFLEAQKIVMLLQERLIQQYNLKENEESQLATIDEEADERHNEETQEEDSDIDTSEDEDSDASASSDKIQDEPVRRKIEDPEDFEFLESFDKMVSDNVQERTKEATRPQTEISIPFHLKKYSKKTYEQLQSTNEDDSVNFILMLKKGNKQTFKSLQVPVDSELASNLKSQEMAEQAELRRVKQLTLDINNRQEEEDYKDLTQVMQKPIVTCIKDKKLTPNKGTPDAESIFGKKKSDKWV
ncbi:regulator of nonsense transcripts 2 isoform X1 [Sipha flava]|uniref:Regulator of nonsense transcripts 2 n=1 Tax=Sipha flava TaxID=143950 RepID=A0A2S2QAV7_9HEMI|nr:regulator of nonsense transcripts 2 isoform X1 [Sipha flava]XP_025414422.1 regulator of nonsense transcripts 2 isoform X1 [Sipha flava]